MPNRFRTRVLSSAKSRTVREKNGEESSCSQARSRQLHRASLYYERTSKIYFDRIVKRTTERSTFTTPPKQSSFSCDEKKNGLVGKPRLRVREKQLYLSFRNSSKICTTDAGFRWADIGGIIGISERTLRHRKA